MLTRGCDIHQTNLFGQDVLLQLDPDDSLLTQLIGACPGSVMGTIRKLKLRHIGVVMCSVFWQEAIAVNPNTLLCACWWRGTQEGSQGKPGILASRVPRGQERGVRCLDCIKMHNYA